MYIRLLGKHWDSCPHNIWVPMSSLSRYCIVGLEKIRPAARQKRKSHGKASDCRNKRRDNNTKRCLSVRCGSVGRSIALGVMIRLFTMLGWRYVQGLLIKSDWLYSPRRGKNWRENRSVCGNVLLQTLSRVWNRRWCCRCSCMLRVSTKGCRGGTNQTRHSIWKLIACLDGMVDVTWEFKVKRRVVRSWCFTGNLA